MTIYNAYLIKGYLIDKKAPKRIMEALDTLIGGLHATDEKPKRPEPAPPADETNAEEDGEDDSESPAESSGEEVAEADLPTSPMPESLPPEISNEPKGLPLPKQRKAWSPEARAAQAERMRARQAQKKEARETKEPEPSPPHRLTVAHPGYAGKREDGQINDEDWPHIKARLDGGDTPRAIASDYDVDPADVDFFIASHQRREAKQSPGESHAPL